MGIQLLPSQHTGSVHCHYTLQAEALFEEQGKVLQSIDSPLYHWYHSCSNPGRHQQMHVVQAIYYHSTQDTSEKVLLDTVTERVQESM